MKASHPGLIRVLAAALRWPFWHVSAFVGLVLFGLVLVAQNWEGTQRTLDQLRAAESDNLTWNLTQVEVDFLSLVQSLTVSQVAPANAADALQDVRLQFDILFSRVEVLRASDVAGQLAIQGVASRATDQLWHVMQGALGAVDGSDASLSAAIPQLLMELVALRQPIRQMSVQGVQAIDAATARQRNELADAVREFARISILMIAFMAMIAVFVLALDHLLRRKAAALTIMGKNLAMIQDVAFDAIVVIDAKGLITSLNRSAERMFRISREAAIGRDLPTLAMRDPGASRLREGLADYLSGGSSSLVGKLVALNMQDSLGRDVPVEGAFMAGTNVDGSPFVVAFLRDVRERLEAEAEIGRALVTARIGEETKRRMIAVLGHELRTALNGVIGSINLLDNAGLDQRSRLSLIRSARTTAMDALRIANNALERSSLDASETGALRTVHYNLDAVIERIAGQHADLVAFHGTRLTVNLDSSASRRIVGDENLISLATTHLLDNAIRFTRNGAVELSATVMPTQDDGAVVEIRVRDNGCGIPQGEHSRIFEDFATLNENHSRGVGGAGLGLGIVARAVKLLDGEISVKSAPGEGSDFCIRYPAVLAGPPALPMVTAVRDTSWPRSVLVVDDNAINRQVLCATLQMLGVPADEACDGQDAVTKASEVAYDVIFMDVAMPRLDGLEATRRIRGEGPSRQAVIVGLTAHVRQEEHVRLIASGMQEVQIKPLAQSALERIIGRRRDDGTAAETENDTLAALVQSLGEVRVRQLVDQFTNEAESLLNEPVRSGGDGAHSVAGAAALFGFAALRNHFLELEGLLRTANGGLESCIAETRAVLMHTLATSDQLIARTAKHSSES